MKGEQRLPANFISWAKPNLGTDKAGVKETQADRLWRDGEKSAQPLTVWANITDWNLGKAPKQK